MTGNERAVREGEKVREKEKEEEGEMKNIGSKG